MIAYLVKDGAIVSRRSGPQEDIAYDADALGATLALPPEGADATTRLDDLYVVNGEVFLAPPRPAGGPWWFDVKQAAWTDPRTLDQIKATQWQKVKASRDAAIAAPKPTSVGTFDADPESQNNLNKVIALVQVAASRGYPAEANYTLADNARVLLTLTQLETAALEMGVQVQGMFDAGDALRQQIDAATTTEEIEGIAWA